MSKVTLFQIALTPLVDDQGDPSPTAELLVEKAKANRSKCDEGKFTILVDSERDRDYLNAHFKTNAPEEGVTNAGPAVVFSDILRDWAEEHRKRGDEAKARNVENVNLIVGRKQLSRGYGRSWTPKDRERYLQSCIICCAPKDGGLVACGDDSFVLLDTPLSVGRSGIGVTVTGGGSQFFRPSLEMIPKRLVCIDTEKFTINPELYAAYIKETLRYVAAAIKAENARLPVGVAADIAGTSCGVSGGMGIERLLMNYLQRGSSSQWVGLPRFHNGSLHSTHSADMLWPRSKGILSSKCLALLTEEQVREYALYCAHPNTDSAYVRQWQRGQMGYSIALLDAAFSQEQVCATVAEGYQFNEGRNAGPPHIESAKAILALPGMEPHNIVNLKARANWNGLVLPWTQRNGTCSNFGSLGQAMYCYLPPLTPHEENLLSLVDLHECAEKIIRRENERNAAEVVPTLNGGPEVHTQNETPNVITEQNIAQDTPQSNEEQETPNREDMQNMTAKALSILSGILTAIYDFLVAIFAHIASALGHATPKEEGSAPRGAKIILSGTTAFPMHGRAKYCGD
jgi:hypothetical protein